MSSFEGANPQTPAVRCVLLHAASGELPGELLGSLAKRVERTIVCTSPYKALAEACLIEKERHDNRIAGNGTPESDLPSGVLLLVNPRSLSHVAEVIEAAKVYAPSLARWFYDRSANPKLRAIVDSDVTVWTQARAAPGSDGSFAPASSDSGRYPHCAACEPAVPRDPISGNCRHGVSRHNQSWAAAPAQIV